MFVPGGLPTITYNPREKLQLEEQVRDYLESRHKILSVSGPTKSGKTVLLRSVVTNGIWVSGGEIHSFEEFWSAVADQLEVFPEEEQATSEREASSTSSSGEASARPLGVGVRGAKGSSTESGTEATRTTGRRRPIHLAAKERLLREGSVLVIDDFHYVDFDVQLEIIRSLKDAVFEGAGVILAAVPHRAYDAVRVEKEMTGRVEQLQIEFWSTEELLGIAREGFRALNVQNSLGIAERLADESFQSPFLMQDFCLEVCKKNEVREASETPVELEELNWPEFFKSRASAASKAAFDLLARGPRQRTDRKPRLMRDRTTTDIYGAVLAGIAHTGPLTSMTYEELRSALRYVLSEDPPQRHEVTRVLEEMSKIARDEIEGEPVVDFDAELGTLHISDPYFAYFLRWAIRNR